MLLKIGKKCKADSYLRRFLLTRSKSTRIASLILCGSPIEKSYIFKSTLDRFFAVLSELGQFDTLLTKFLTNPDISSSTLISVTCFKFLCPYQISLSLSSLCMFIKVILAYSEMHSFYLSSLNKTFQTLIF